MSDQPEQNNEPLVTLEIRLRRFLTPEGGMAWRIDASPHANCVDMLGLLGCGQAFVYEKMRAGRDEY
jgi:hypothetical protein